MHIHKNAECFKYGRYSQKDVGLITLSVNCEKCTIVKYIKQQY